MILKTINVNVNAYVSKIGKLCLDKNYKELDLKKIESSIVRCPDKKFANKFIEIIDEARKKLDTIGGVISCIISGCPIGIGEPIFSKLHPSLILSFFSRCLFCFNSSNRTVFRCRYHFPTSFF